MPCHILARDERSAAFMADAYARVSFQPGVCEGPSGAGATYLAAGLAEPHASSIPVIALNSDTPLNKKDCNVLTALNQPAFFAPITKWSTLVKQAGRIPDIMRQAFRLATNGRPGAVQITLPMDVLATQVLYAEEPCQRYPAYRTRPDPAAVERAVDLLLQARQPVIVAGGGTVISGAWVELTALAEALGAPVGTSICGKGAIAEDHPLSIGVVGCNSRRPYANALLQAADLILYVGCKTDSVTTSGWSLPPLTTDQTILHLDVDPAEIGRNYPTTVGLVGDARLGLHDLLAAARARGVQPHPNPLAALSGEISAFWADFKADHFPYQASATDPDTDQAVAGRQCWHAHPLYCRLPALGCRAAGHHPPGLRRIGVCHPWHRRSQVGPPPGHGGRTNGRRKFRNERRRIGNRGPAGAARNNHPVLAGSKSASNCSRKNVTSA